MKKTLYVLLTLFLISCSSVKNADKAEKHDYNIYKSKTIHYMQYAKDDTKKGNVMIIIFTDGTTLRIYSEDKMKILK